MAANAARTITRDGGATVGARWSTVVISSLGRSPRVGAGDRDLRRLLRGAQDDRRLRRTHALESADAFGEEIVERSGISNADLEHEAVFAGDVVNFLDFGQGHESSLSPRRAARPSAPARTPGVRGRPPWGRSWRCSPEACPFPPVYGFARRQRTPRARRDARSPHSRSGRHLGGIRELLVMFRRSCGGT